MQVALTTAQQTFQPVGTPEITAPFVQFSTIDLTGDGGTVFCSISLDHPNVWPSQIFENSRFLKLKLDGGKVSCISKSHKLPTFRRSKADTADKAVAVINRYLARVIEAEQEELNNPNWVGAPCHY